MGWPSPAPHDLAAEEVALDDLAGLDLDAPAQVRVVQVDEAAQVLPGGLHGPGGHDEVAPDGLVPE
eukprot:3823737-Alexandrium_andersonii.AAC.1